MFKKSIVALGSALLLSSCATILSGTSQTLNVRVIDQDKDLLENAHCTVYDGGGGSYALTNNPGTVKVTRSGGSVTVNCSKKGYKQLNTSVGDSFNAVTIANILFWPGFIVDAASGSYKKYPSHYEVQMVKK
jgi:hypothetical protein